MVHDSERPDQLFHREEGVTQGDPLAMISYGIGVLPLTRELRDAHPRVPQPCYFYDVGEGGIFGNILVHLRYIHGRGPAWG